jgi:hypothetical protein
VEGEERKAPTMPVRKKVDQRAARQPLSHAPADQLSDAGARYALLDHRLGVGKGERPAGRNLDRLLATNELPVERPPGMGIDKLQAAMVDEVRGMGGPAISLEIARRRNGEDWRLDQLA